MELILIVLAIAPLFAMIIGVVKLSSIEKTLWDIRDLIDKK